MLQDLLAGVVLERSLLVPLLAVMELRYSSDSSRDLRAHLQVERAGDRSYNTHLLATHPHSR